MIPPRVEHLHHLLRTALYGGIVRYHGRILIDGTDANLAQTIGMSALNALKLLDWSENGQPEMCWLNTTGNAVLDAWERELWGPPTRPMVSDRPLTPACLNDSFTAENEKELLRLIYEVTPEDLTGTDQDS